MTFCTIFNGNFPMLVPPNFWTIQVEAWSKLGRGSFETEDGMMVIVNADGC